MLVLPVTSAMSLPPALPATDLDNAAEMCPPCPGAKYSIQLHECFLPRPRSAFYFIVNWRCIGMSWSRFEAAGCELDLSSAGALPKFLHHGAAC